MNLLERIDRRLSDTRARIHPLDFEDCATSMLTTQFPGLVPITGGTDFGLDAENIEPEGVVGLIITSSRTWDGARQSLRGSLTSMARKQVPVRKVMVANLAELSRLRREKLKDIAGEFGCELLQTFDRAWFANAFRANPDWRMKILNIAGGPFSLSREPRAARPDADLLQTIGRDELLAKASVIDADLVLWGVPGAGKSHVASRLPGALFLDGAPSPEQLLDDLTVAAPSIVVVDDAGSRLEQLDLLVQLRRKESLFFRIATTCWPHDVDDVTDHLPNAERLEVDLLTREEIGELLRQQGVTRLSVLVQLLEQAQGRPAWALNLSDLLTRYGDWQSVWTGRALREQILAFLRSTDAPRDAVELLGAIALLGEVDEDQARRLGGLFQLRPVEFHELITSVAIAGLVDGRRVRRWHAGHDEAQWHDHYRVMPRVIAASIVSEIYFAGHATAVKLADLRAAFPERAAQIVQTQIYCKLVGASDPLVPSTDQVSQVLPSIDSFDQEDELLRSYALLGAPQRTFVTDLLTQRVRTACTTGDHPTVLRYGKALAARVADTIHEGSSAPVDPFLSLMADLSANGISFNEIIHELVEEIRDARSGDTPTADDLLKLAEALSDRPADQASTGAWVRLACEVLTPTFDGNYMSPERLRQMVLQSFTWAGRELTSLYDAVQPGLRQHLGLCTEKELSELIDLLQKWIRIAHGTSLPFGGRTTPEQEAAAEHAATAMANDLATVITTPGLRAAFNRAAAEVGVTLAEPDPLFACLTAERELLEDWEEERERAERELSDALVDYLQQPPEVLIAWLVAHQPELARVRAGNMAGWRVLNHIAATQADPTAWLKAAIAGGLGGAASTLIDQCIASDSLDLAFVRTLLDDKSARSALISAVLRHDAGLDLVSTVIDSLHPDDIAALDSAFAVRHATDATRRALFTHPDPVVRSSAAALWAAERTFDEEEMPVDPEWVQAMGDLTIPSPGIRDYMQDQALKALAKRAPNAYIVLLVRHANEVEKHDDFDEWQESVSELDPDDRNRLWEAVKTTPMAHELFWVIAANDEPWIRQNVADTTTVVPPSRLLHAWRFQFGPRLPLSVLAEVFLPLGLEPDDILWTLDVGMHDGEDHERYARHLQVCRDLAESPDPHLARVGQRGVEIYEKRLTEATKRARDAAVRGMHGF